MAKSTTAYSSIIQPVPEIAIDAMAAMAGLAATPTIGSRELTSLYAVMAYVADQQGVRQDMVQAMTETEFSIDHISKLRQQDYQNAMTFLIDLRIDEIRSQR